MIKSYFFIPASHPKLLEKIETIIADHIIIDLEDAVKKEDLEKALQLLSEITATEKYFIRPPLFRNEEFDKSLFLQLKKLGFRNYLVPKFRTFEQLKEIENCLNDNELGETIFILVIENPESLFGIREIILSTKLKITGLGFGSQDYCTETGMHHTYENLKYPRFLISGIAKSFHMNAIDIACMEVKNKEEIKREIADAFELGFEGKFLIHPMQIEVLENYIFYTDEQIREAEEILEEYLAAGQPAVFSFNGKAIEPPHIRNFEKIIEWSKYYGKQ
jgi:citrate lyase beta subunit